VRSLRHLKEQADLVVVGGGLSGVCCAVTAARKGIHVILVQDRPVLGGNASSEVRLWVLGATSHMGNNNRWAREGGIIDELLVENTWRNPEGNPVIFDSILLEMVRSEPKITLLLNTAINELDMNGGSIARVSGYNSQNQTAYTLEAPLFVDASGDGILGFLAGAEFRMGAEPRSEFNEGMAPETEEHSLLGHSLYFYSRDTGRPVKYVPPTFALQDITRIPRYRDIRVSDTGCRLWWLEYGGSLDTVGQTEEIKWELWSVAYGVWNYIKNSGEFPDVENLTLEWMGTIPGKRESRRFIGDVILKQNDIVKQNTFPDAVSFGGWAIDLHPSDGVFSPKPGCIQYHAKGVYQIPFRTMYSRNVSNLFLAGRLISTTHIAFGSTRVMATYASNGQAVGMAAVLCTEHSLKPRDLVAPERMHRLQQELLAGGQHIPGVAFQAERDRSRRATASASSSLTLQEFSSNGELAEERSIALLIPFSQCAAPALSLYAHVESTATLHAELWTSERCGNTTPDLLVAAVDVPVAVGDKVEVHLDFMVQLSSTAHYFVMLPAQPGIRLHLSNAQVPGVFDGFSENECSRCKEPGADSAGGLGDRYVCVLATRAPSPGPQSRHAIPPAVGALQAGERPQRGQPSVVWNECMGSSAGRPRTCTHTEMATVDRTEDYQHHLRYGFRPSDGVSTYDASGTDNARMCAGIPCLYGGRFNVGRSL
jgi:FAD dependent oxidoreductase